MPLKSSDELDLLGSCDVISNVTIWLAKLD